jgi:hypothetical protein
MNTSFSQMNSSLSQKWMNKKSQIGQARESGAFSATAQMSSTVAAGFVGAAQNL